MARKILVFLCLYFFASTVSANDSLHQRINAVLDSIVTFKAGIKRFQIFNNYTREARGRIFYTPQKTVCRYTAPGKFLFFYTDSCYCAINLNGVRGYKKGTDKNGLWPEIESFGKFMLNVTASRKGFFLKGILNERNIYENIQFKGPGSQYIGVDRTTGQYSIIENFDSAGVLLEQVTLYYNKPFHAIPTSITVRRSLSGYQLIDSVEYVLPQVNGNISDNEFGMPENIRWIDTLGIGGMLR